MSIIRSAKVVSINLSSSGVATIPWATTGLAGLMTAADKKNLNSAMAMLGLDDGGDGGDGGTGVGSSLSWDAATAVIGLLDTNDEVVSSIDISDVSDLDNYAAADHNHDGVYVPAGWFTLIDNGGDPYIQANYDFASVGEISAWATGPPDDGGGGGVTAFIALTDTPSSYAGEDGKILSVGTDGNGDPAIVFIDKADTNTVTSVNGQTGDVTLDYSDVGADQSGSASSVQSNLNTHESASNPHSITAELIGAMSQQSFDDLFEVIKDTNDAIIEIKAKFDFSSVGEITAWDTTDGDSGAGGVTAFIALTDTPSSYANMNGKIVAVDTSAYGGSGGLVFIDAPEGGGGDTNIIITQNSTNSVEVGSSTGTSDTITAATSSVAGIMSNTDKSKLDGIATGAEVNVNADWNASSGDAQILNKPSDITDLSSHSVTELNNVSDAGSGKIISDAERTKLDGIESGAQVNTVTSVNGYTGAVSLDYSDVGALGSGQKAADSDKLDNLDSSQFLRSDVADTAEENITFNKDIYVSGNVGIKTDTPAEALHVVGNIVATGEVTAHYSSDRRFKDNIKPLTSELEKILKLTPVSFKWNNLAHKYNSTKKGEDIGLIAQDVEKIFPDLVHDIYDEYKSVDYVKLSVHAIGAIKEQQEQIQSLKERIKKLEQLIEKLI